MPIALGVKIPFFQSENDTANEKKILSEVLVFQRTAKKGQK